MRSLHMHPGSPAALRTAFLAATAVVLLAGCGNVFRATIQGRVVDSDDDSGLNGATVRVYEEEPNEPDSGGFLVQTRTRTAGGTTGVFDTGVVWQDSFAAFGDYGTEADTATLWLGVTAEDYAGTIVELPGILSDETNDTGDIPILDLDRDEDASTAVVQGQVLEEVNGDRVAYPGAVIVIEVTDTFDENEADTGETGEVTVDDRVVTGQAGAYAIVVEWPEEAGFEAVRLELTYYEDEDDADAEANPILGVDSPRGVTVEDGDARDLPNVVVQ